MNVAPAALTIGRLTPEEFSETLCSAGAVDELTNCTAANQPITAPRRA